MNIKGLIKPKIEVEFWASPKDGDTIEDLVSKLEKQNYKIITIDKENNKVKLGEK